MSFVLSKEDFSAARIRTVFPYFLVLWLGIVLFLVFLSFLLKRQLQDDQISDVEKRLGSYLAENPVSGLIDITRQKGGAGSLQGLAFIRLVTSSDQMLFAENSTAQVDFHQLAGLDPRVSGVWISLGHPDKCGSWTIVSRKLAADMNIQAGKEDPQSVLLYERMMRIFRLGAFLVGIPAWVLVFACVIGGALPVRRASADIAAILADGRSGVLLPEKHTSKVVSDLYGQLNKLLRHNQRLIAEMQDSLDNVAHDLRTPMTRLRAVAEYGLQTDASPERLRDALLDCLEESERVLSMLKIMMTVAEAESGTMHLRKEWVDLSGSLAEVVSLYEYVAEEKKIAVKVNLEPGLRVFADRTRIAQVWANLLDNSIKYGKEGGYVVISSESDGEDAVIVFTDDGIGISKSEIHRIWERLYRGDRSRTQPGLGLGLNYVRAVVEAHGGTVDVESELQKGTRLTVRLKDTQREPSVESTKRKSQISGA